MVSLLRRFRVRALGGTRTRRPAQAMTEQPVHEPTQSFIIRIWYEETGVENGGHVRRGSIEQVSTQERLFFNQLKDVIGFIEAHALPGETGLAPGHTREALS